MTRLEASLKTDGDQSHPITPFPLSRSYLLLPSSSVPPCLRGFPIPTALPLCLCGFPIPPALPSLCLDEVRPQRHRGKSGKRRVRRTIEVSTWRAYTGNGSESLSPDHSISTFPLLFSPPLFLCASVASDSHTSSSVPPWLPIPTPLPLCLCVSVAFRFPQLYRPSASVVSS